MRKLFIFLTFIAIVLISGYYYYLPEVRWRKAAQSAGGYPYQIGLTNTQQNFCILSCCTPLTGCVCCSGGSLCSTKDVGTCSMYAEISGSISGGSGTMALFSKTQISTAGYKPGDSIIAGGMTMTEMDNGVLATPGGCSGCGMGKADSSVLDRIANIAVYIIAGFKNN